MALYTQDKWFPWYTCTPCGKRIKGWNKMDKHLDTLHPAEVAEFSRQQRARELAEAREAEAWEAEAREAEAREAEARMREYLTFIRYPALFADHWPHVAALVRQAIEQRRYNVPTLDADGSANYDVRRPQTDAEILARLEVASTYAAERLAEATAAVAKQVPA